MTLKLDRLPDRESVKITFSADADLKAALNGQKESVADLIPFMLAAFMNADPGFKRARKELQDARPSSPPTKATEV